MVYRLAFRRLHHYDPSAVGIPIPVTLSAGHESLSLLANLDTGSSVCLFRKDHGEVLGLQLERGIRQRIRTATGALETFGHTVWLAVFGMQFDVVVYFAASPDITRAVLGRTGFLDRVSLALIDYDRNL